MSEPIKVSTPLGPLFLTFTSGTHVCVHTNRDNNEVLTVRGVRYYLNSHFHLWADGRWHMGAEDQPNDYERRCSFHATRCDWQKVSEMNPSRSAFEKMAAVAEFAVNEYTAKNPAAKQSAELEHLAEVRERAIAEYNESLAAMVEKEKAMNAAEEAFEAFCLGGYSPQAQKIAEENLLTAIKESHK